MKFVTLIAVLMLIVTVCGAADKLNIPKGITYQKTTTEINQRAEERLIKSFTAKAKKEDIQSLFETKCLICGPALWQELKDDTTLSKIETGTVMFQIPVLDDQQEITQMQMASGKLFQSPDEVWVFWNAFVKRTDFSDLKIRKLNPFELELYWAMISFDITEPLFVLESKKHKILTVFRSPDDLTIVWIDDYQNCSFGKEDITD